MGVVGAEQLDWGEPCHLALRVEAGLEGEVVSLPGQRREVDGVVQAAHSLPGGHKVAVGGVVEGVVDVVADLDRKGDIGFFLIRIIGSF